MWRWDLSGAERVPGNTPGIGPEMEIEPIAQDSTREALPETP